MRNFANRLKGFFGSFYLKAPKRNQCVAALAIAGLYLQLAAGAFCTGNFLAGPDLSLFPICHSSADGPASPGHPPQQQHSCPFCALHCHAALALMPGLHFVAPVALAALAATPQTMRQSGPRFALAAQPRGPPYFS